MNRFFLIVGSGLLVVLAAGISKTAEVKPPPSTPKLIALGKQIYVQQCAACHGIGGRGDGEAAYLLYPKPRDFVAARYRLVSTWERVPTDQDLFDTISRGMPGSAMPSWEHLAAEQRWALVYYIKSLAEKPIEIKAQKMPSAEGSGGEGIIEVPKALPFDAAARARALELYKDACASCHGDTGRGDGAQEQKDDEGFPTRPRDLTTGVFKGSPDPIALYRHIVAGIPGSPMPMSDWSYGPDAWHLVNYVRSLSSDTQRQRVEMKKFTIQAARVKTLPDHPESGIWRAQPPINLHLMPLWWRSDRPGEVTVRAASQRQGDRSVDGVAGRHQRPDRPASAGFPRRCGSPIFDEPLIHRFLPWEQTGRTGQYLDVEIGTPGGSGADISRRGESLSESRHRFLSQSRCARPSNNRLATR